MTLKEVIKEGISGLSALYPEREAREMVHIFLEHFLGISRHTHIIEPYYEVSDEDAEAIRDAFRRMASGEPLQYVTGKAYFYGREFNVSPDVLIPRPETEILCRTVLDVADKEFNTPRILDLCTGSGCIAWTLSLEMPGARITALDISDGALAIASSQDFADEMSCTGAQAPDFIKADVLSSYPGLAVAPEQNDGTSSSQFDIIVSNPPYVMESEKALMRPNVLEHEPHLALFVPDDDPLLFYRAVAEWALRSLKPGGFGIVEINEALAFGTEEIFRNLSFSDVHTIKDLNDRDRFVFFRN